MEDAGAQLRGNLASNYKCAWRRRAQQRSHRGLNQRGLALREEQAGHAVLHRGATAGVAPTHTRTGNGASSLPSEISRTPTLNPSGFLIPCCERPHDRVCTRGRRAAKNDVRARVVRHTKFPAKLYSNSFLSAASRSRLRSGGMTPDSNSSVVVLPPPYAHPAFTACENHSFSVWDGPTPSGPTRNHSVRCAGRRAGVLDLLDKRLHQVAARRRRIAALTADGCAMTPGCPGFENADSRTARENGSPARPELGVLGGRLEGPQTELAFAGCPEFPDTCSTGANWRCLTNWRLLSRPPPPMQAPVAHPLHLRRGICATKRRRTLHGCSCARTVVLARERSVLIAQRDIEDTRTRSVRVFDPLLRAPHDRVCARGRRGAKRTRHQGGMTECGTIPHSETCWRQLPSETLFEQLPQRGFEITCDPKAFRRDNPVQASRASSLKCRLIAPLSEPVQGAPTSHSHAMARRRNAAMRFDSKRAADT